MNPKMILNKNIETADKKFFESEFQNIKKQSFHF